MSESDKNSYRKGGIVHVNGSKAAECKETVAVATIGRVDHLDSQY